jgi:glyoxylase-like metal-dependent hydrolase (beta-lactamase superfamily II)
MWPQQRITEVADGTIVVLNGLGGMGVANATCVIDGEKAFVVDTMTFPEMAEGMVREIARRGAHTDMVLNTHPHIDHVGGNMAFAGARIISHPASVKFLQRLGLPVKMYDTLMPHFRGRFDNLELVIPEPAIDQLNLPRGGELHVFTSAHTLADLVIWFPESRVLLAGDISFIGVTPLAVHGLLSGWIEAIDTLLALNPAVIVPGHGAIGSCHELRMQRDYLAALYRMGQRVVEENLSLEDALAAFDAGPVAEWIEPDRTVLNLERAIQEVQGEINQQDVSMPPPSLRRRAA